MDELTGQIKKLLDQGQKIQAVKAYREATGASLIKAMKFVESVENPDVETAGKSKPNSVDRKAIIESLRAGNRIQAVKQYRDATNGSLKDANKFIARLQNELRQIPEAEGGLPQASGCLGVLLGMLFLAIVTAVATSAH